MSQPKRTEHLVGVPEIARMLDVSPSTIYEWTRTGYIPHFRLGIGKKRPCVRFSRSAVRAWLEERKRNGRDRRVPV